MFRHKRIYRKNDHESVEAEVQKLVDAGLVRVYDGDHLRLTDYGMRVAEQLREEERSATRARFHARSAYNTKRKPRNDF